MFRFLCPVVLNLNFLMVREGVFLCFLDKNAGIYAGMVLFMRFLLGHDFVFTAADDLLTCSKNVAVRIIYQKSFQYSFVLW